MMIDGVSAAPPLSSWEQRWSPYDDLTYQAALNLIEPDDVVLDIGAGDLRFACRASEKAKRVYAIEQNRSLLPQDVPENVFVITEDARYVSFPTDITIAVLLMRHCTHFQLYAEKLKAAGCTKLVTNARWGMGVECVELMEERLAFTAVSLAGMLVGVVQSVLYPVRRKCLIQKVNQLFLKSVAVLSADKRADRYTKKQLLSPGGDSHLKRISL